MNRLKLTLTALLAAALVVASLPLSASANAQTTPFPPLITNSLTVQHGNRSTDVTKTYIQYALDRLPQSASSSYHSKEDFQRDYRRALNEGTWGLIQHHYKRSNGDDVKSITYFFNFSTSCGMKLSYDALSSNNYTYTLSPSAPVRDECRFRTVSISGFDDRVYYNKSTASSMIIVQAVPEPRQQGARLFLYSGDYTLHPSAQGMTGELPQTITDKRQPDFILNINESLEMYLTYFKNLPDAPGCGFDLKLDETTPDYGQVVTPDVHRHFMSNFLYVYKLPKPGAYTLRITLNCSGWHPPMSPLPDLSHVRPVVFNFNADGTYKKLGTIYNNCSNGVCVELPPSCDDLTGMARSACRFNQSFSFGVINPSLLALRSFVSSLVVPAEPSCGLAIPAVGNRIVDNFSPSVAVSSACSRAKSFHRSFPIFVVVGNFVVATAVLWLIVRAINNLLDHRRDEVVGGL